jgi:Nif-specific regulatory protein
MGNVMDSLKNKVEEMEREEIINALRECNWIMARAARRLGITERMIGYKVKKYGIRVKEVRWIGMMREETKCGDK